MKHALFRIISGISYDVWEYMASDTVRTLNDNAIVPCIYELLIQESTPDFMHQLRMQMGDHIFGRWLSSELQYLVLYIVG
jgi:hypothetical protein